MFLWFQMEHLDWASISHCWSLPLWLTLDPSKDFRWLVLLHIPFSVTFWHPDCAFHMPHFSKEKYHWLFTSLLLIFACLKICLACFCVWLCRQDMPKTEWIGHIHAVWFKMFFKWMVPSKVAWFCSRGFYLQERTKEWIHTHPVGTTGSQDLGMNAELNYLILA